MERAILEAVARADMFAVTAGRALRLIVAESVCVWIIWGIVARIFGRDKS